MPVSSGRRSLPSTESLHSEQDVVSYVRTSIEDLGKAYNLAEERIHIIEESVNVKLDPGMEDAQNRIIDLLNRISKLEEIIGPFEEYKSQAMNVVNKLEKVKSQTEALMIQTDLSQIDSKFEDLSAGVRKIASIVAETTEAQHERDAAMKQEMQAMSLALKDLNDRVIKTESIESNICQIKSEVGILCAESRGRESNSLPAANTPSSTGVPRTRNPDRRLLQTLSFGEDTVTEATPVSEATATQSMDDAGRTLLTFLSQGQKLDDGILRDLAGKLMSALQSNSHATPESHSGQIPKSKKATRGTKQANPPRTPEAQTSSRVSPLKRVRADTPEEAPKSPKRLRSSGQVEAAPTLPPLRRRPSAPASSAKSGIGRSLRRAQGDSKTTPPKKKAKKDNVANRNVDDKRKDKDEDDNQDADEEKEDGNDGDDDDDNGNESSPPEPRRTSRAFKPTERAKSILSQKVVPGKKRPPV